MQNQKPPYPVWTVENCKKRIEALRGEVDAARGFGTAEEADAIIPDFWKKITTWVKEQREVYKHDPQGDEAVGLCMLNMLDAFEAEFEVGTPQGAATNETDIFSGLDTPDDLFASLDAGAA